MDLPDGEWLRLTAKNLLLLTSGSQDLQEQDLRIEQQDLRIQWSRWQHKRAQELVQHPYLLIVDPKHIRDATLVNDISL